MGFVKGLKCRECGREYSIDPIYVCEFCFGPLEVVYDYDGIKGTLSREKIASRPNNLWRYRELLPIDGEPTSGLDSGYTPLVRADRLATHLGMKKLYRITRTLKEWIAAGSFELTAPVAPLPLWGRQGTFGGETP